MTFAPTETKIWDDKRPEGPQKSDDREINERYARGEGRIVIETNREKLPSFASLIKQPGYLDVRPFYQRRPRWDARRQSLLIESFLMNIPVPPVFLYERDYNSYEVMDGQQRITAVKDFYANLLELTGLEMWGELNGRKYHTLPDKVKAGIDRRSITSIVLLKESTADEEDATLLRETVFDRLNTGGVKLERQEIRNAMYQGRVNDLLLELSRMDAFREIWGIPRYTENEMNTNPDLLRNTMFSTMGDLEIILRFFALRHAEHYTRGMQGFLDLYMVKATKFTDQDADILRTLFVNTLALAGVLYEDQIFRPYDPRTKEWASRPHRAFADAVMVGLSRFVDCGEALTSRRDMVRERTKQLFFDKPDGTFTGRGNSKSDVQERIGFFADMIAEVLRN